MNWLISVLMTIVVTILLLIFYDFPSWGLFIVQEMTMLLSMIYFEVRDMKRDVK